MGSEYLVFYNKTELNTGSDNSLITSNNVGISNTNPVYNLSIGSNVYMDDAGANTIVTSGNVAAGYFVGNGSRLTNTAVALTTIGYVGVGLDSPTANLHVSGNVHVTDEITCVGDITGNTSDDRLKIRLSNLENALEKVIGLQGFRYEYNELAQGFGLKNRGPRVGLSAQDVQKVLPEAVTQAPFSDQYLTLKYERLVPLLVESIKELSEKVNFLKNKILSNSS